MKYELWVKYPFVLLAGFLVTFLLVPAVRRMALGFGMVDMPGERRLHERPVPRGGGVAVFIGFHAACAAVFLLPWANFTGTLDGVWWRNVLVSSGAILLLGLWDDRFGLRPMVKLAGQALVALLAWGLGMRVGAVLGFVLPVWLDAICTVLWFVALTNAFNLIDGMDGLAAGLAAVGAAGLIGLFLLKHLPGDALVLLGLLGACLAFLRYNFHPASIFLGDSGSMFLGFLLAAVSLATVSKATAMTAIAFPFLTLGIPLFDTLLAVWRRMMRRSGVASGTGDGIFDADTDHVHHRLVKAGFSPRSVATWLWAANAALVCVGLLSLVYRARALGIYLLAFVAGSYVIVRHLARTELWESEAALARGLGRPTGRHLALILSPALDVLMLAGALALALFLTAPPAAVRPFKLVWFDSLPLWVGVPFLFICLGRVYSKILTRARILDHFWLGAIVAGGVVAAAGLAVVLQKADSAVGITVINLGDVANTTIVMGQTLPRGFALQSVLFAAISIVLLVGYRMVPRALQDTVESMGALSARDVTHVLVYGVRGCESFLRWRAGAMDRDKFRLVGLLSGNPQFNGCILSGCRILGGIEDARRVIKERHVEEVIVVEPMDEVALRRLVSLAGEAGARVFKWSAALEMLTEAGKVAAVR
jgi:UDP-GlcNAc:undecaprenyl-phosphate/decaprenyl-phosphate GlcNAc-1-phosphate transferase